MWLDDIEDGALEQALRLANLPFAFKHVAIMPDAHQGYGMPIGGVLATKGVIVPNAVGVDIGCGVIAVRTTLDKLGVDVIKQIMGDIRTLIPVGRNHHSVDQKEEYMPNIEDSTYYINSYSMEDNLKRELPIVGGEYKSALRQIGTLGGGNHFIEIQKGDDGRIWIMVHSGSRNIGYKVAKHYNALAYDLNTRWYSDTYLPKDKEQSLAFLPTDSKEGKLYIKEMQYCVDFALANRKLMMERLKHIFCNRIEDVFGGQHGVEFDKEINIPHNYATLENHYGENVWVHRKGATKATLGLEGLIPGSQGTASYIVKGLGAHESYYSCSHGAGRKMGRKDAKKKLKLSEEIEKLNKKGIVHGIRNTEDLDEASGAYKDIDIVMANQADLVEITTKLEPLAVVKG